MVIRLAAWAKIFFSSPASSLSLETNGSPIPVGIWGLIARSVKLSLSTPSANAKNRWIYTSPLPSARHSA